MDEPMDDAKAPDEISDLMVEQLALGVLAPEESVALRRRLNADGDTRLDAIAASDAEILQQYPPQMMAARLRRHMVPAETRWRGWIAGAAAVAAVAAVWWMAAPGETQAPDPDLERVAVAAPVKSEAVGSSGRGGYVGIKGDARLLVYRKTADGSDALRQGDTVAPGEFIQVGYDSGGAAHGVIVSVDGSGGVTLHQPATEDSPTDLQEGRSWLEFSLELDAAPDFERFVLVTAAEPLDPAAVLEATRALANDRDATSLPIDGPQTWSQASFLLRKP